MAFPEDELCPTVGIAYGADKSADPDTWTFTDETEYAQAVVVISRGRANEQATVTTSDLAFGLVNPDGRFSPRNPYGPNYGRFAANTPARVTLDPGTGFGPSIRATAFVPEWDPRWTAPDTNDHVSIGANGILRRLGQGSKPVKDALTRAIMLDQPHYYWPITDKNGATSAASAGRFGEPMTVIGTVNFGQDIDVPAGTSPLPGDMVESGGGLTADLDVSRWAGFDFSCEVLLKLSATASDASGTDTLLVIDMSGDPDHASFRITWAPGVGGDELSIGSYTEAGFPTILERAQTGVATGWRHIAFRVELTGGNTELTAWLDGVSLGTQTDTNESIGKPDRVTVTKTRALSVGQLAIYDIIIIDPDLSARYDAVLAWVGELAHDRFARLCLEEGIASDVAGTSTVAMGEQQPAKLVDLLRECEAAEHGLMAERRSGHLGFDCRSVRENQPVKLTLDYEAGHLPEGSLPRDDDQLTRNIITASRQGGSSYTVEDVDGPKGTDPVTGVWDYDHSVTLSLASDTQLPDHAGYLLNQGTVDEPRWPRISLDLKFHPELIDQWLACDLGSRVQVINLPTARVGNPTYDLVIEGYLETMDAAEWTVELNCAPYTPHRVFTIAADSGDTGEFVGRLVPDRFYYTGGGGSTVDHFCWPPFTTVADDYPVWALMGGEEIEATAVAVLYSDTYTRTETDSWGSATSGQAYALIGTAANFDVAAGVGTIAPTTADSRRFATVDVGCADADITVFASLAALPASGVVEFGPACRLTDNDNYVRAGLSIDSAGVITPFITANHGAGEFSTPSGGLAPAPPYVAGALWGMRLVVFYEPGTLIEDPLQRHARKLLRVWPVSLPEPAHWHINEVDTAIGVTLTGTRAGCHAYATVSTTSVISFDNVTLNAPQRFTATRAVNGVAKTHAVGTLMQVKHPAVLGL